MYIWTYKEHDSLTSQNKITPKPMKINQSINLVWLNVILISDPLMVKFNSQASGQLN